MKAAHLTETLTLSGELTADEIAELAGRGVRMIINARADGEAPDALNAPAAARIAREYGMDYRHIPVALVDLRRESVEQFAQAIREADGPVHAHCGSGLRAATLWALGVILEGHLLKDEAIRRVTEAGFDPSAALSWLDNNHTRQTSRPSAPASSSPSRRPRSAAPTVQKNRDPNRSLPSE